MKDLKMMLLNSSTCFNFLLSVYLLLYLSPFEGQGLAAKAKRTRMEKTKSIIFRI